MMEGKDISSGASIKPRLSGADESDLRQQVLIACVQASYMQSSCLHSINELYLSSFGFVSVLKLSTHILTITDGSFIY